MATSVATLLQLPGSKSQFGKDQADGRSSPVHKVARLHADSDVSHNRQPHNATRNTTVRGPDVVRIMVEGEVGKASSTTSNSMSAVVQRGLRVILSSDPFSGGISYEKIFDACRYQVAHGLGATLHDQMCGAYKAYAGTLLYALNNADLDEDCTWLAKFAEASQAYIDRTRMIKDTYACLDHLYASKNPGVKDITSLARDIFAEEVFLETTVLDKLRNSLSSWASWERDNQSPHDRRGDIKKIMNNMDVFGLYSVVEEWYFEMTQVQYAAKAEALRDHKALDFFRELQRQIELEFERSKCVLQPSSYAAVRDVAEQAFVKDRLPWLAKGTIEVLDDADVRCLSSVYRLFQRVNSLDTLRVALREHVDKIVSSIVMDKEKEDNMVQRLLDYNEKCQLALTESFTDVEPTSTTKVPHARFKQAVQDGFRTGFQKRKNKPAEMIAKYLDRIMQRGQKGESDAVFHGKLDAALALYRFTDDKDVFRAFYHRQLSKRILSGRSASDDIEQEMLKKLKRDYDAEFGVGEEMFKDLVLSRDMMAEWHEKLKDDDPCRKLNVQVLQQSVWSFSPENNGFTLPPKMQEQLTAFERGYYAKKHTSRRLFWTHSLGTMELRTKFKQGYKHLSLTLYQGVVMLLFSDEDALSYDVIKGHVGLGDKELKLVLQSLACGKKKVLKKVPPGQDINDSDIFEFNANFTDDKVKLHIKSVIPKAVEEEESTKTQTAIDDDRKHIISAAIVRIMKAKKELSNERLKEEVIKAVAVHFKPTVDAVKRQIEWCVNYDYLERSGENMNVYIYKA